jgi:hypothetical protein
MGLWASLFSSSDSLKSREQQETRTLYNRVRDRHMGTRFGDKEKAKEYRLKLFYRFEDKIPLGLRADFYDPYAWLLLLEEIIFDMPEMRSAMTLNEMVELREALRRKERFFANQGSVIALLEEGAERIFTYIGMQLPEAVEESPFTIPLAFALPNPKEAVRDIIGELYQDRYAEAMLFVNVSRQIHYNLCQVSGITDPENPNKPYKLPTDNNAPLSEIVDGYFRGTPFHDLFNLPVPLRLRDEEFFQHMHVLGGSGAGKTQLIQTLILHHIQSDASLVIIDSQGDLIDKVSRLEEIEDRVILLTPKDIQHPPAINIFDIDRGRLGSYDELTKEQVTAGVIDTFDYLFTGLIGADLTAKQGVLFRYIARLMLAVPETMGRNATILDMIRLMDGIGPYQAAVDSLSEIPRTFFERDFKDKTFDQTKEQIRYRLQAIIENPTLARLFTSPRTKVDLFDALNNGSIILIDTAKDFLKGASSHFGRIFISLVLQAVLERAVIPEGNRKPAFLICDEAHEYFDDHVDDLGSPQIQARMLLRAPALGPMHAGAARVFRGEHRHQDGKRRLDERCARARAGHAHLPRFHPFAAPAPVRLPHPERHAAGRLYPGRAREARKPAAAIGERVPRLPEAQSGARELFPGRDPPRATPAPGRARAPARSCASPRTGDHRATPVGAQAPQEAPRAVGRRYRHLGLKIFFVVV